MTETVINRRIVLARRPQGGKVSPDDFRLEEVPLGQPADGQVLVRNRFLSIDPYMRGRLDDVRSYVAPQKLDEVMVGATAGEVVASRNPRFALGDTVEGRLGWQLYALSDGRDIRKVDASRVPLSAFLGVAGMPGVTAWVGLNRIIEPKAGQTIVVSAASGAVGSVVGQLAKQAGCRVVGVAGGPAKCKAVVEEFGFNACVDYKAGNLGEDLRAATPDRIDGYFENVGGPVLDAVLGRMNAFGRIAVCGLIAGYDGEPIPVHNFRSVLVNRLLVQGFIVSEFPDAWPPALAELEQGVADGRIRYRETVANGLASAPGALIGLLKGENFGKQVVALG
jgi:NADPH-dependent curcumin reductase